MSPPAESERLIFREWSFEDIEPFHAICSDQEVMKYVLEGEPWPESRVREFIAKSRSLAHDVGYCRWALIHKTDATLIGFCGFVDADGVPEIGWRLAQPYWGQGLATEAARRALEHGFVELRFPRVMALVQSQNRASLRVIEKLGMHYERRFDRQGREVLQYALSRDDWDKSHGDC